jgi:hypothetical protein
VLLDRIRLLEPELLGTREGAPALRGIGWFVEEAREGRVAEDYLLVGVEEVATALPALHYYCSYGPLALFAQLRIERDASGGYRLADEEDALLAEVPRLTQLILERSLDAPGPPQRLLVVDSFLAGAEWHLIPPPGESGTGGVRGAIEWLERPAGR